MMIDESRRVFPEKPIVSASGLAGIGEDPNSIKVHRLNNYFYIVRDLTSEVDEDLPLLALRVGIVAHMQANIVLRLLLEREN